MVTHPEFTVAFRLDSLKPGVERAGIIPYVKVDGKIYFLLAQDTKTKELGDFGGGRKKGETPLFTAFREWSEESRGMFDGTRIGLDFQRMYYSPMVYHPEQKCGIIFVKVSEEWRRMAVDEFSSKIPISAEMREVSAVRWVSAQNMVKLIKKEKKGMWRKIRKILGSIDPDRFIKGIALVAKEE